MPPPPRPENVTCNSLRHPDPELSLHYETQAQVNTKHTINLLDFNWLIDCKSSVNFQCMLEMTFSVYLN